MKYPNGQDVRLGDRVKLGQDDGGGRGFDRQNAYRSEYSKLNGVISRRAYWIEFRRYGLIHYEQPEPDLQLIARAQKPRPTPSI